MPLNEAVEYGEIPGRETLEEFRKRQSGQSGVTGIGIYPAVVTVGSAGALRGPLASLRNRIGDQRVVDSFEQRRELLGPRLFRDVPVRTQRAGSIHIFRHVGGPVHHNLEVTKVGLPADPFQQFEAVHHRHANVQQHKTNMGRQSIPQKMHRVGSGFAAVKRRTETNSSQHVLGQELIIR